MVGASGAWAVSPMTTFWEATSLPPSVEKVTVRPLRNVPGRPAPERVSCQEPSESSLYQGPSVHSSMAAAISQQPAPRVTSVREGLPENMPEKSAASETSHPERSRVARDLQSLNMTSKLVTPETSRLLRSMCVQDVK